MSIARSVVPTIGLERVNSCLARYCLALGRSGNTGSVDGHHTGQQDLGTHNVRQGLESPCLDDLVTAIPLRSCAGCRWHLAVQSVTVESARELEVGQLRSQWGAT